MTVTEDSISKGKILRQEAGRVVFSPANTSYELHLEAPGYAGPTDKPVKGVIRATARKVYTMPSGGNFVTPILGTPRIVQGRVITLDEKTITLQAGARFVITLPTGTDTVDLHTGGISAGSLVNAVLLPGAMFEVA
jgi:hypothetical protein